MSVRFGLLALLAEAPTHGYQLKATFEHRTGGAWAINIGQIYTTLQRLERDGLIGEITGDGERRRYCITPVGRRSLQDWFATPVSADGLGRDELTLKVLLAVAAREVDARDVIQRQRRKSLEQLQAYTRRKARANPTQEAVLLTLLDALIYRTEAEIRWLDTCEVRARWSEADGRSDA